MDEDVIVYEGPFDGRIISTYIQLYFSRFIYVERSTRDYIRLHVKEKLPLQSAFEESQTKGE